MGFWISLLIAIVLLAPFWKLAADLAFDSSDSGASPDTGAADHHDGHPPPSSDPGSFQGDAA